MIRIGTLVLCLLMTWSVNAQIEMSLSTMTDLWQRNWLNPSVTSEEDNFVLSLPGIYFGFDHSGEPFKDVWSVKGHTLFLDTDKWVDNLDDENDVYSRFEMPTIELAWQRRDWTLSVGHSFKNQLAFKYPKDLIELIHYGNAPYIGETLDIGVGAEWMSYSAFHVGVGWKSDLLSVGARIQILNGIQYLKMDPAEVSVFTNDDIYQLEFKTDLKMLSSSFISADDIDALDFELTGLEAFELSSKNTGVAFDVGLSMNLSDDIRAELSILDLGFINWEDASTYTSKGEFTYEGVEIRDLANFDTLTFKQSLDTIGRILNVEEEQTSDFNTDLTARVYLNLHWQATDKLQLSALYASESYLDDLKIAYGLGAHYNIFESWGVGTVISNRFDRWNWGLNTRFKLGIVEVYILSDNVLSSFNLGALGNGNARAGINLTF